MNLMPKGSKWGVFTTQVMRMSSAGSRGSSGSGEGSGTGGNYENFEQKPDDLSKMSDYSKGDSPTLETPKNFSTIIDPRGEGVPAADPLYMAAENRMLNNTRGRVNKDIVENLRSYFDDQIMYYKTMANYNKSAMKRIKKIKKNWSKMLE